MTSDTEKADRLAAARRRDRLCDRFERGESPRPTIESLLDEVPEPERDDLLRELVALDVWRRRREGETLSAAAYLDRFPRLDLAWLRGLLPSDRDTEPGPTAGQRPATTVGGYEILGELSRGGMGVVYRARQQGLKRLVALKVLRDASADADERSRLRAEAEAAARLQHAHIVQVFEVGEYDGQPFLAMELCDGGSLATRLAGTPLSAREAAELVQTLAEAVLHAHERGVVHRDLKPANVLMTAKATLKVADFGLARRLDAETLRTQSGDVLGTPSYMAPEQALGRSREAGTAADVYSLGAILYECLTGRPPFKAANTLETLRQVVNVEPVSPRQLQPNTPRDLNTICLHCLHKEPHRRYSTAQTLADDLGRFLRGEPVRARPVGPLERVVKWTWRNPFVALLVVTLGAGVLATSAQAWRAEANAARASEQEAIAAGKTADANRELERSQKMLYLRTIAAAQQAWRDSQFERADVLLAESPPELWGWEHRYLRRLVASRGEVFETRSVSHFQDVVFAPDGTWVAGAGDGGLNVWDAATRRCKYVLGGKMVRPCWSLAVRPDSTRLAAGGEDGTVKIWDVTTGKEVVTLQAFDPAVAVRALAFSPDGKWLACGGVSSMLDWKPGFSVWDVEGWKIRLTPKLPPRLRVHALAFSPDGKTMATASELGIHLWDATTGELRRMVGGPPGPRPGGCLAFHPTGRWLVVGYFGAVVVWDLGTGQVAELARGVAASPLALAVRPDGTQMAAGVGNRVLVWEFLNTAEPSVLRGHTGAITGLAYAPDGRIATASYDQTVRVWNPGVEQDEQRLMMSTPDRPSPGLITGLTFLDSGRRLGTANVTRSQLIWDLESGKVLEGRIHFDRLAALLPADRDGTRLFTWSDDRKLWTCDATGPHPQPLGEGVLLDLPEKSAAVTVSRDGKLLAALDDESHVGVWDTATGQRLCLLPGDGRPPQDWVRTLAFAPDGRTLLRIRNQRTVEVWDVATGQLLATRPNNSADVQALACSPDARHHAVGCVNGHVHLWDLDASRPMFSIKAHDGEVREIVYTSDGKRIVTVGRDGAVRLWDVASGQEALTLRTAGNPITRLAVSPDGSRIAVGDGQGNVRVWEAGPEETP